MVFLLLLCVIDAFVCCKGLRFCVLLCYFSDLVVPIYRSARLGCDGLCLCIVVLDSEGCVWTLFLVSGLAFGGLLAGVSLYLH